MMLRRVRVNAAITAISLVLAACSFSVGDREALPDDGVPTLAHLEPAVMPDTSKALPRVDLETLASTYRDVLEVSDDAELRLKVLHRLAGLEMKRGEQGLYDQAETSGLFALAIEAYQTLLNNNPDHPNNDRLLYQLSKAYDLEGATDKSMAVLDRLVRDYPQSVHYGEAQFRRAEIYFSRGDYRNSERAYAEVINLGADNVHYRNALYMHGWSQFKRERYRASLQSFTTVLDLNVPENNNLDQLQRGERELTMDTFRIMSVVFSYIDGPTSIAEIYSGLGERHYMPLLYDNLGKLYLEQERYRDSADTYRTFVNKYPQSDLAPVYSGRLIEAYIAGGFAQDVLTEKQRYVKYYGIHGDYWAQKSEASRDYIRPFLKIYLPELARHFHAKAQENRTRISIEDSTEKPVDQTVEKLSAREKRELKQLAQSYYLQAGDYYQEFIDTFPEDTQVPEMYFLLAESRFEAEVFDQAIAAYEIVAYKYTVYQRGADAGYSAIIAYGRLLAGIPQQQATPAYESWVRRKIASQLRFATTYAEDKRAPAVLTKSAEELLALQEYLQALAAATQLVNRDPPAEENLRRTAWLVIGHSEFELLNYANAEVAYSQTLELIPEQDTSRPAVVERLAASVYKQAEEQLVAGDQQGAAQEFLRVAQVAPGSSISVTAKYDAANTLMNAASWGLAIGILESFRRDHPDHELSANIPAKLVIAYQEDEQWAKAADELTAIYETSEDVAIKQESLYQAAEMYEKAGDKDTALLRYRSYANNFPDPFPIAMEARYKLSTLYQETGQQSKRRFWLQKIIDADAAAGSQRTTRSRYLAASAATVFADDDYQAFASIELTLPLKKSLKKKKRALNTVLASYRGVSAYGVEQFATLATYRIGEIYRQLSRDLMDSQRPQDLDALAMEQYEILLEEQAFPFEEKAIDIHEANAQRSWQGIYDEWTKQSFSALKKLLPARYDKPEQGVGFASEIY